MGQVPGPFIAGAVVPALMLALLFYFDHTVSSQLAQLPEFNLHKPPAYSYDLLLVGLYTIGCGLLGLPPVNGVLPQVRLTLPCIFGQSIHDSQCLSGVKSAILATSVGSADLHSLCSSYH